MDVKKRVAIMYDFDETLAPGNTPEYSFIPMLGMEPGEFWKKASLFGEKHNMDSVLAYMYMCIKTAKEKNIKITNEFWHNQGKDITFFEGVETWFKRINEYGASLGLEVEHYIISCGIKEVLDGIKIAKEFKRIFACGFSYDEETGEPIWPSHAINYTSKTQYIYRIRKDKLDKLYDAYEINEYVEDRSTLLPYTNMIYVGDGETDVPCMKLVKLHGGRSVCVFNPNSEKKKRIAQKLYKDGRVNFIAQADYRENSKMESIIKDLLMKISIDNKIGEYSK